MIRLPKPALAALAGLVVVFASACGSSSSTPVPAGSTGPGASSMAGASAGASVAATVNANDASSIITQVVNGGSAVKSFHLKLALSGTIKAAAIQSMAGSSGSAITSDIKLDGTAIEGDVDVANAAAHLTLNVPGMQMLGNVPITGDLILKDSALYYKVSLLGTKYTKTDLGSLSSLSPVAVPTPGASALAGVTDEITALRAQMDAAGVKATLVGVEQIGGKDAYHITISGLSDYINTQMAAASAPPTVKIDSASVDMWVYKDNNALAQVEIKGASSAVGNLDFTLTVTNYDQPVTITAPAASEIQSTAP